MAGRSIFITESSYPGIDARISLGVVLGSQLNELGPLALVSAPNNFDVLINDVRAFYKFRNDVDALTDKIQALDASRNKYGKFLYEYKNGKLKITNVCGNRILDKGTVL